MPENVEELLAANLSDPFDTCFNEADLSLSGSPLEAILMTYLFPVLAITGVVGNALNIVVLRENKLKRSYFLFYCIALSDIFFFLTLIPSYLASFDRLARDITFRQIFFAIKIHCNGLANWLSAFNIWIVGLISLERFYAVNDPMKTKLESKLSSKPIILAIIAFTFVFTSYAHYEIFCKTKLLCNDTQLAQACLDVRATWQWNSTQVQNSVPDWVRHLVAVLRFFHAGLGIVFPLIVVTMFNFKLMRLVKRAGLSFNPNKLFPTQKRGKKLSDGNENDSQGQPISRRHSETMTQQQIEHRITRIAIVIMSTFLITHAPSAIYLVIFTFSPFSQNSGTATKDFESYEKQVLFSFLTMCGKAFNFFIFCTLSSNFRKLLWRKLICKTVLSPHSFNSSGVDNDTRRKSRRFNL